jgi:hypothetical protein
MAQLDEVLQALPDEITACHSCKSLDLILRTMSDLAIHPTAEIIGEANPLLSMTALQGRRRRRSQSDH